jgi:hypothetical protein
MRKVSICDFAILQLGHSLGFDCRKPLLERFSARKTHPINLSRLSLSLCGCRGRRKRPISATLDAYSKDRAFDSIPCRRRHCRMWSARACFCRPAVLLFAAIFPDNDSSLFAAKHLPLLSAFKKLFFDSTTDDLNAPCMRYRNLQSKSAPESTGVV